MIPSMGFNAWFVDFYFLYAVSFISSGAHSLVNSKPNMFFKSAGLLKDRYGLFVVSVFTYYVSGILII
jgi:hypothetical protein